MKHGAAKRESVAPAADISRSTPASAVKRGGGRTAVRLDDGEGGTTADKLQVSEKKTPKRVTKRGNDVRQRILQAALECFGAFGYEGTSTRAVADRAKVTHTLVLYHFQTKEQLWIATMEAVLDAYGSEMYEHIKNTPDKSGSAGLRTFIEQFIRMSARQPQIHRILTMESNQGTSRLGWVIDHYLRKHFSLVKDLIKRGQDEGKVRECDPARLYYLIIGAGGTPFTVATEYKELTGRDVFSEVEILRNIAFLYEIVFIES